MKSRISIIYFLAAFTLLLSASFDSIAQVKCRIDSVRAFSSEAGIRVAVRDSLTKEPLPGAIVMLYDGTEAREHVMDVRTWNPMEHIGQLKLEAEAGVFTGGHDLEAGGVIGLGDFDIGARPSISANILGSHNHDVSTPSDMLHANVSVGKNAPGKYSYNTTFLADINGGSTSSGDVTSYLPSYAWNERSDTSSSYSSRKSELFSLNHSDYRKLGKAAYKASYSLSYGRNTSSGRTLHSSVQDKVRTGFNKASGDTVSNVSLSLTPSFTIPFAKRRRSMSINPHLLLDRSFGSGYRLDTMKTSMASEWLTHDLYSSNTSPSLTVSWREPLGKKSILKVSARASYTYGKIRKLYFDELSGTPDLNNTRDFTTDNITGEMTAVYTYGQLNGDGLYLSATAGIRDMAVRRDEKSGNVKDWKGNYLRPVIGAALSYSKGAHELSLNYSESEKLPAVEQLRNTVDDASPMFLYAGNPELRMSVERNIAASYGVSIVDRGIAVSMRMGASVTSDVISLKKTYFTEDTFFQELNYTVSKGTSLTMPVNLPQAYQMSCMVNYDQYFSRPRLTFGLYVSGSYSDSPFYIADELMRNSFSTMDVSIILSKYTGTSSIFLLPERSLHVTGAQMY